MFHFLVKYNGWALNNDSLDLSRSFEYTEDDLVNFYKPNGNFDLYQIRRIPALFASETNGDGVQLAKVGYINHVVVNGRNVKLRYSFDSTIPPISNEKLKEATNELEIGEFELSRTHWAIKDIDLFKFLYTNQIQNIVEPRIFSIEGLQRTENELISVMMPFDRAFNEVFQSLKEMSTALGFRCLRADDIWENDAVIQDIVSLICRSKIVVCDCTGRNPNVFYEAGIAHALGKSVILITQSEQDIPFDLRHIRYLRYLNNNEGRSNLASELSRRVQKLMI